VERGLDGKDLASAYVLCPLGWQSSYFGAGGELSRDGVWTEVRTQIKGSRFKSRGGSESKSESEKLQRRQGFAKSVESQIR
jgi:hypothetical protein